MDFTVETAEKDLPPSTPGDQFTRRGRMIRWGIVLLSGLVVTLIPVPAGIEPAAWRLLAIFVATIVGSIARPISGGAMVLLGVSASALSGANPIETALKGYADPIVWLVLAAFFISAGMVKTGLGRRIAFLFIKAIGHRSLGLGYAMVGTDMLLASVIPSNGARSGGILFPIATSLAEAYDSRPGPTARRLGSFLMVLIYQCEVIICAIFLTGQASNALIAKFARQVTNVDLSYTRWLIGGIVPGIVSLAVVPLIIYKIYPPTIKRTPGASLLAAREIEKMGPISRNEKLMLMVFLLVAGLWITTGVHGIHYAAVALLGICVLLLTGVVTWNELLAERSAWDVFVWYGGLLEMADRLGQYGVTKKFADFAAGFTVGWHWWWALALLLLIYFYIHYGFASITAHVTAMFIPFLLVILGAGAPPWLAVLSLAYLSNLNASLTHYGTTPAPIYFGAHYVSQGTWWRIGLIASVVNIIIWMTIGVAWWKLLGWW